MRLRHVFLGLLLTLCAAQLVSAQEYYPAAGGGSGGGCPDPCPAASVDPGTFPVGEFLFSNGFTFGAAGTDDADTHPTQGLRGVRTGTNTFEWLAPGATPFFRWQYSGSSLSIETDGNFLYKTGGVHEFRNLSSVNIAEMSSSHFRASSSTGAIQWPTTAAPTCTSNCGTDPTVSGAAASFTVTMGSSGSPASGFVITWAGGVWASAPQCVGSMARTGMAVGKLPLTFVTTTTTLTVATNGTAPATEDVYHFICSLGFTP